MELANFFSDQGFGTAKTSKKIRSNFENHLREIGILDEGNSLIHLELDDGWLADAMQVVAQHESNRVRRHSMVTNPAEFLIANEFQALANATADDLRKLRPILPDQSEPSLEPEPEGAPLVSISREWDEPQPSPEERRSASVEVDPIKLERANRAHHALVRILRDAVVSAHLTAQYNAHIDLHFDVGEVTVLCEMKSCHQNNLRGQIRRGVAQLLEYRYVYRDKIKPTVLPVLVIETQLSADQAWLSAYLRSIGMTLSWRDATDRLVTTAPIPEPLDGILHVAT